MKLSLKYLIKPFYYFLLNIGFDPCRMSFLRNYPKYLNQYFAYKKAGGTVTHRLPILTDYDQQAGQLTGHYFHQDLLVAKFIKINNPLRHIDIGSRIDGFVAHVASFRQVEVIDIRDLKISGHKNISFIKADLMDKSLVKSEITDSISCLHAIEHFGLGRYGDKIDPNGHKTGFNNIFRMLKPNGKLYISFPIAKKNEIHFNAHRVFHPKDIFTWPEDKHCLKLERFDYIDDYGTLHQKINIDKNKLDIVFGCGIYTFRKII